MSLLRIAYSVPVVAAALLAGRTAPAAVTVLSQDFDGIAAQSIGDWGTIGSGTGYLAFRSLTTANSNNASIIVDPSGNHALQFTHAATDGRPVAWNSQHPFSMSSNSTGNNELIGSFTYKRLLSSTNGPAFVFLVDSAGNNSAADTITAIQFTVNSDGHLSYQNGIGTVNTNTVNTTFTLNTTDTYTFQIDADFSSATQDKWSLTVTHPGGLLPDLAVTGINTRAANIAVDTIAFRGDATTANTSTSPFAQIDNINFSVQPVPEPASMGLLAGVAGLLLRRKR